MTSNQQSTGKLVALDILHELGKRVTVGDRLLGIKSPPVEDNVGVQTR